MLRIVLLFALMANSMAWADEKKDGPFGIYMGMPISELDYEPGAGIGDSVYVLNEVPGSNPLDFLVVVTAPINVGVCEIVGLSGVLTDEQVVAAMEGFSEEFYTAYGTPVGPVIDLEKKYEAHWRNSADRQLPHNLELVILSKWFHDSVRNPELPAELRWFVNILFAFKNTHSCPNRNIEFKPDIFLR